LSGPSTPVRPPSLLFGTIPIDLSVKHETPTDPWQNYETASEGDPTEKASSEEETESNSDLTRAPRKSAKAKGKQRASISPPLPPPPFEAFLQPPPSTPKPFTAIAFPLPSILPSPEKEPQSIAPENPFTGRQLAPHRQRRIQRKSGNMSQLSRMPPAHGTNHPIYDPEKPSSINRFFKQVELAREGAGPMTDEILIKYTLAYLPEEIARQWEKLPYASRPEASFEKWKQEVIGVLADEAQEVPSARSRLLDLVRRFRRNPVSRSHRGDFFNFALAFQAEAEAVEKIISNRDLVPMFLSCLNESFRDRLIDLMRERVAREALAGKAETRDEEKVRVKQEGESSNAGGSRGKNPETKPVVVTRSFERTMEDPYHWEEVVEEAQELVRSTTLGPFGDYATYSIGDTYERTRGSSVEGSGSKSIEAVKAKQADLDSQLQKVLGTLDAFTTKITDFGKRFDKVEGFLQQKASVEVFQQTSTGLSNYYANSPQISTQVQQQPGYHPQTQNPRAGYYSRPPNQPFDIPPRVCYYCRGEGHMMFGCNVLAEDQKARRVTRQGMNVFVKGELLSRDSPDGLSMKQRADAILAGTYRQDPKSINFISTEDWGWEDEPISVFLQNDRPTDVVTSSMLQQSMERMRLETQGAISTMTNQILQTIRTQPSTPNYQTNGQVRQPYTMAAMPASTLALPEFYQQNYGQPVYAAPAALAPSQHQPKEHEVSNAELRDLLQSFGKRIEAIEEVHLQTRTQAVKKSNVDFR